MGTAGWRMFALLTLVSGASVAGLVFARWWLAGVLLGIGLGAALGWTCLILMVRGRGGRSSSARFVYFLWLMALARVLAVGSAMFFIAIVSLMVSVAVLSPVLVILGIANARPPLMPEPLQEIMIGCAITVFPLLCCGFCVWRWIWPLARRWWRDDLRERSASC